MGTVVEQRFIRSRRFLVIVWPVLALLACAVLWSVTLARAHGERARADAQARKEAGAFAAAYEQYITRSVGQMDQIATQLKYSWEHGPRDELLEQLRRDGMFTDAAFSAVALVDRGGVVRSATRPALRGLDLSGASFFKQHKNAISTALRVGTVPPQLAPVGDEILFTRRLDTSEDEFDGVVVLAVDARYFTSFVGEETLGPDGLLAVAASESPLRLEQHATGAPAHLLPRQAVWTGDAGVALLKGADGFSDGRARVLGWRRSSVYPLVATVSLSYQAALAGAAVYWHESRDRALAASALLLALGAVGALLSRRLELREREHEKAQRDISERKAHENALERLANQDGLTGLQSRGAFLRQLPAVLDAARARQRALALLFIDLDEFKHVNDAHGHGAGDQLLKAAAQRLQSLLRPSDRVARFGGDEFLVLLDPCAGEREVGVVAQRIVDALAVPFSISDELHAVGASIGIALFPRDGHDADALIRHSDMAMYAGKNDGKGRYRFFDPTLSSSLRARSRLKQSLLEAIEADQFVLHYQPRVDPRDGRLLSMEALLRWQHPVLGMVPPGEFIPLAEATGLIVRIGELVMDKACAQVAAWRGDGVALVPVSINVSARQFQRGAVPRQLAAAMARHRVPGSLVEVEITESAMMSDQDAILAELAELRALGIKLHVDDFGTGYSSLSQLQRLRMDVLKVDRAFTAELGKSKEGTVFFQAIVSMAHALGMGVVAEGVETQAQLDILRGLGCNEVQGFLVSRPVAAREMAQMMKRRYLVDTAVRVAQVPEAYM